MWLNAWEHQGHSVLYSPPHYTDWIEWRCDTTCAQAHTYLTMVNLLNICSGEIWLQKLSQMYRCREPFLMQFLCCVIVDGSIFRSIMAPLCWSLLFESTMKAFFSNVTSALWCKARFNFSWKSRTPTLHLALFHLQVNIWRAGLRWQITLSYHPPHLFWPLSCPQSCLTYIQSRYNLDGYAANC